MKGWNAHTMIFVAKVRISQGVVNVSGLNISALIGFVMELKTSMMSLSHTTTPLFLIRRYPDLW